MRQFQADPRNAYIRKKLLALETKNTLIETNLVHLRDKIIKKENG